MINTLVPERQTSEEHTRFRGSSFPNEIDLDISCCRTGNEMSLTVQIQADKHLQQHTTVSQSQEN
jgi:hypothetical protein